MKNTTGWLGVDIGTYCVKMAQVERHGDRIVLRDAAVVRRRAPWSDSDHLRWHAQTSAPEVAAVRALGTRFRGRSAASTAPMAVCELRGIRLADVSEAALHHAVTHLPGTTDTTSHGASIADAWPIGHPAEASAVAENNVNILSLAREWSLQIVADLRASRLHCQVLDGTPVALARAVALATDVPTDAPIGIVDWGFTRTTFCVVLGGRALFVRTLRDAGLGRFVGAARDALALSWEEAATLVEQFAIPAHDTDAPADPAGQLVCSLVATAREQVESELQRTLAYLRTHRRPLYPKQLLLFGGGAMLHRVEHHVGTTLELPTRAWQMASTHNNNDDNTNPMALFGPAVAASALAWES